MVHMNLAGRVNSEEYAICERLLDILSVTLPDFTASKTSYRQDKWPSEAAELSRVYGFRVPTSAHLVICEVIVWFDTGRLLCTDVDAFSTFVERQYGVQLDLSDAEVMIYIKANVDEMRLQQPQHPHTRAVPPSAQ
ncbi:hypothetical protein PybrP1_005456 [[Pythium] brassicae (nom. inval.)]|nr:hypothetical protein PybrP1_005456 [[Pythium] brassicae (nom. inval.)]